MHIGRVRFAVLLSAALLGACDLESGRGRIPVPRPSPVEMPGPPTPPSAPPPTPGGITQIGLGEMASFFAGPQQLFEFTAESQGTLVVKLYWELGDSFLNLSLDGVSPGDAMTPPVEGRLPVVAGQKVLIAVNSGGTDEQYNESFSIFTFME
jgi:hypothetical protein